VALPERLLAAAVLLLAHILSVSTVFGRVLLNFAEVLLTRSRLKVATALQAFDCMRICLR